MRAAAYPSFRVSLSKRDESIPYLFCVVSIDQAVYDSADLDARVATK